MASVSFTSNGSDPLVAARSLVSAVAVTAGDALYAAAILHHNIRARTESGVDVEGVAFPAYSEKYKRAKEKAGNQTGTVDLFGYQNHTHMLNTIVFHGGGLEYPIDGQEPAFDATPADAFAIGFYGDEANRAQAINEGLGNQPRRHFFDANAQDVIEMESGVGKLQEARLAAL